MWSGILVCFGIIFRVCKAVDNDPSTMQLQQFRNNNPRPVGTLTTVSGNPIQVRDTSAINSNLIRNPFFLDFVTSLETERIPERLIFAKGAGAFGYFEVTNDVTDIIKSDFLNQVGKITPIATRFSNFADSKGSADTTRDFRGYSVKFYTQEGNWDFVGLSDPVSPAKDPIAWMSYIHSQKPNPKTNLFDNTMSWDFKSLRPESMYSALYHLSDYGIYDGYRRMPGYSIHTYQVENNQGVPSFVRFQFLPDLGIKTLTTSEAQRIAGIDPDYYVRDLYNAIEERNFPSWTMYVQVLSLTDVENVDFDPFDVTRTIPTDQFPLRPVGKLVLNRNPVNYYAEVEQIAFTPGNLVPGILGAPDELFETRVLAQRQSQTYALGSNVYNIAVNCPLKTRFTYNRDGQPPVLGNGFDIPNYYPNSFNGPIPIRNISFPLIQTVTDGRVTNFRDAARFYQSLDENHKNRLVAAGMSELVCTPQIVIDRTLSIFTEIDSDLGDRLRRQLATNATSYNCAKY